MLIPIILRTVGPILLQGGLGGLGGGGAAGANSFDDDDDDLDDDDDDDDDSKSNGDAGKSSVSNKNGSKVSISLPTFAPDTDDDEDEEVSSVVKGTASFATNLSATDKDVSTGSGVNGDNDGSSIYSSGSFSVISSESLNDEEPEDLTKSAGKFGIFEANFKAEKGLADTTDEIHEQGADSTSSSIVHQSSASSEIGSVSTPNIDYLPPDGQATDHSNLV